MSQTSWVKRASSFYYITSGSSLELPLGPALHSPGANAARESPRQGHLLPADALHPCGESPDTAVRPSRSPAWKLQMAPMSNWVTSKFLPLALTVLCNFAQTGLFSVVFHSRSLQSGRRTHCSESVPAILLPSLLPLSPRYRLAWNVLPPSLCLLPVPLVPDLVTAPDYPSSH